MAKFSAKTSVKMPTTVTVTALALVTLDKATQMDMCFIHISLEGRCSYCRCCGQIHWCFCDKLCQCKFSLKKEIKRVNKFHITDYLKLEKIEIYNIYCFYFISLCSHCSLPAHRSSVFSTVVVAVAVVVAPRLPKVNVIKPFFLRHSRYVWISYSVCLGEVFFSS